MLENIKIMTKNWFKLLSDYNELLIIFRSVGPRLSSTQL